MPPVTRSHLLCALTWHLLYLLSSVSCLQLAGTDPSEPPGAGSPGSSKSSCAASISALVPVQLHGKVVHNYSLTPGGENYRLRNYRHLQTVTKPPKSTTNMYSIYSDEVAVGFIQ